MGHAMKFLRAIVHNIKVQAHAVWLCARDQSLGWGPRLLAFAIAGYALSPLDLIPDFIPVLGLLDDAILIPFGIWLFIKMTPPEVFAPRAMMNWPATGQRSTIAVIPNPMYGACHEIPARNSA